MTLRPPSAGSVPWSAVALLLVAIPHGALGASGGWAALPAQWQLPVAGALLRFLANPNVAYLLFVLGLLGIVGEVVSTGTIVPGTLGGIALVLGLVGLGQLPTNWGGALLIVVAVVLFLVDIHTPGHALSVAGTVAFVLGSLLLFTPFWVSEISDTSVRLNLGVVLGASVATAAFFIVGVTSALRSQLAPLAVGVETLIGKTGVVRRDLAPVGIVHVEGEDWSAVAAGGEPVPAGTSVQVVATDGLRLEVQPVSQAPGLIS